MGLSLNQVVAAQVLITIKKSKTDVKTRTSFQYLDNTVVTVVLVCLQSVRGMLENPTEAVSELSYFDCIDSVMENSKVQLTFLLCLMSFLFQSCVVICLFLCKHYFATNTIQFLSTKNCYLIATRLLWLYVRLSVVVLFLLTVCSVVYFIYNKKLEDIIQMNHISCLNLWLSLTGPWGVYGWHFPQCQELQFARVWWLSQWWLQSSVWSDWSSCTGKNITKGDLNVVVVCN